jgi:hypothetical protein
MRSTIVLCTVALVERVTLQPRRATLSRSRTRMGALARRSSQS